MIVCKVLVFPDKLISALMIGQMPEKSAGDKSLYFENEKRNNNPKCTSPVLVL